MLFAETCLSENLESFTIAAFCLGLKFFVTLVSESYVHITGWSIISYILSKNKKYPCNNFHARVNGDENTLLSDACLETLTILATWQGSLFIVLVQMMKSVMLQT